MDSCEPLSCDDGDPCTGQETCDPATGCESGPAVACTPQDACHEAGVCDPAAGLCSNPPRADGPPCDCARPLDCEGWYCVETMEGSVCAQACDEESPCPRRWRCFVAQTFPEVRICRAPGLP